MQGREQNISTPSLTCTFDVQTRKKILSTGSDTRNYILAAKKLQSTMQPWLLFDNTRAEKEARRVCLTERLGCLGKGLLRYFVNKECRIDKRTTSFGGKPTNTRYEQSGPNCASLLYDKLQWHLCHCIYLGAFMISLKTRWVSLWQRELRYTCYDQN